MPKIEYIVNPLRNPPMLQEEKFALLQATHLMKMASSTSQG